MSKSDVVLDDTQVKIIGSVLTVEGADLCLDAAGRRSSRNKSSPRRALVHDFTDGLTLNWDHDYPGGMMMCGPTRADRGLLLEGDCVIVRRKKKDPPPTPGGRSTRSIRAGGSSPSPLDELAVRPEMTEAKMIPYGAAWEKSVKTQVARSFGGEEDDYEVVEVFTQLERLAHEIATLKAQVASLTRT